MKERYRLFLRRKSVYYAFDNTTKTFESLKTKDKAEATRLLLAFNEAGKQPAMNLGLARVYLKHSDPMVSQRTWQHVMDEIIKLKSGPTQYRWQTAAKDKAFDLIRSRLLIETQAGHLLEVLRKGTVSTNVFLRKLHNFALDMNWLMAPVIVRPQWPRFRYKEKRAITWEEHLRIVERETNPERRALYCVCWHLGGAQTDMALLRADNIDWKDKVLNYARCKTSELAQIHIGPQLEAVLRERPGRCCTFQPPFTATDATGCSFGRRLRVPKIPRMLKATTNPGKRYACRSCRCSSKYWHRKSQLVCKPQKALIYPANRASNAALPFMITHTRTRIPKTLHEDLDRHLTSMPRVIALPVCAHRSKACWAPNAGTPAASGSMTRSLSICAVVGRKRVRTTRPRWSFSNMRAGNATAQI